MGALQQLLAIGAKSNIADGIYLQDDFDGTTLHSQWAVNSGTPVVSGGVLSLPASPACAITSTSTTLNVTNKFLSFQVFGLGDLFMWLKEPSADRSIQIRYQAFALGYIRFTKRVGSDSHKDYMSIDQKFLRIRHVSGTPNGSFYFDTSADGATWTQRLDWSDSSINTSVMQVWFHGINANAKLDNVRSNIVK